VRSRHQDEPGVAFLNRLLSRSEKVPERVRPASATPEYDHLKTADMVARFQSQLEAAERSGGVTIRRGKRERSHLIDRVTVKDAMALARHLGRTPSAVAASRQRAELSPSIAGAAARWVEATLDEIERRWSRGEAAYRLGPGETQAAAEFLSLLTAISADLAKGLDARTFSLKVTGDSKAFDRHATRIASVLSRQFDEPASDADVLWKRIGLERFAHPVHVRGPVRVERDGHVLVDGMAPPFASIHPEMLPYLKLTAPPALLMTIENYTSFNRYVREVHDGSLIVYTGGFASAGTIEILRWLISALDAATPVLHWGDIDPGGLRIFRVLEEVLPRPPKPHLMQRAFAEMHGKPATPDPTLAQIAKSDSAISSLAQWLAEGPDVRHLEQEALAPESALRQVQERQPDRLAGRACGGVADRSA
jgi:hypothetical protein